MEEGGLEVVVAAGWPRKRCAEVGKAGRRRCVEEAAAAAGGRHCGETAAAERWREPCDEVGECGETAAAERWREPCDEGESHVGIARLR